MSNAKDLVGDRQFIDIREWHRAKLLEPCAGKDKEFTLHWEGGEWVRSVSVEVKSGTGCAELLGSSYRATKLSGEKCESGSVLASAPAIMVDGVALGLPV